MPVSVDIISIGTLSRNRFWNETSARRPAHATTTLLRNDESSLIVDPALPPEILRQRLDERTARGDGSWGAGGHHGLAQALLADLTGDEAA